MNTVEYGYKKQSVNFIDINVRIAGDEVVVGFRDDGVPFDPTVYTPEEEQGIKLGGIALVKALAESVQYSRLIGLNSTIIRIACCPEGADG